MESPEPPCVDVRRFMWRTRTSFGSCRRDAAVRRRSGRSPGALSRRYFTLHGDGVGDCDCPRCRSCRGFRGTKGSSPIGHLRRWKAFVLPEPTAGGAHSGGTWPKGFAGDSCRVPAGRPRSSVVGVREREYFLGVRPGIQRQASASCQTYFKESNMVSKLNLCTFRVEANRSIPVAKGMK